MLKYYSNQLVFEYSSRVLSVICVRWSLSRFYTFWLYFEQTLLVKTELRLVRRLKKVVKKFYNCFFGRKLMLIFVCNQTLAQQLSLKFFISSIWSFILWFILINKPGAWCNNVRPTSRDCGCICATSLFYAQDLKRNNSKHKYCRPGKSALHLWFLSTFVWIGFILITLQMFYWWLSRI